jgi:hypothetical protein
MSKKSRVLKMCFVNPAVIDGLSEIVGTQAEIMTRVGISWNTWTKIRLRQPIRISVAERLQSRIIANDRLRSVVLSRAETGECVHDVAPDQLNERFLLNADMDEH